MTLTVSHTTTRQRLAEEPELPEARENASGTALGFAESTPELLMRVLRGLRRLPG
ncbi:MULTISPECIES: hypothetical protein [unclassified Streptomyces]|uniref:hypothetical protein n=1 Tax=unclassified Streptomyces TaxID=2593676 RepID=UPI00382CD30D